MIYACLELYEATLGDVKWLKWAIELQSIQLKLFFDDEKGGFYDSLEDPNILIRNKELYDGAEPCASTVACQNLLRLYSITHETKFRCLSLSLVLKCVAPRIGTLKVQRRH